MAQVAVIGLGRFGFHVAKHLHEAGHEVLAIDIDPQNVEAIADFSSRAVVLDARDKERVDALLPIESFKFLGSQCNRRCRRD